MQRWKPISTGLALVLLASFLSARAADGVLDIGCSLPQQEVRLTRQSGLQLQAGDAAVDLLIEERGHALTVDGETVEVSSISVPFRYGYHHLRLQPGAMARVRTLAELTILARITSRCSTDAIATIGRTWNTAAGRAAAQLTRFLTPAETEQALAEVERLAKEAGGREQVAIAAHLRAQVLLLGGRSKETVDAFAAAGLTWMSAGDPARARVAMVGQAEEMLRLGRHNDVLGLVEKVPESLADRDYFAARLHLAGCLARRYGGQMQQALNCFELGIRRMQALGEQLDAISAMQDKADVQRFLGDFAGAQAAGYELLESANGPGYEVHRGRIALMLGELAAQQGDIGAALAWMDRSLVEFASVKAARWEANALLSSADLYIQLGALAEATELVDAALARLSARDAPARVAAAEVRVAKIALEADQLAEVDKALNVAIDTYERLGMPAELDGAQVWAARTALRRGQITRAEISLAKRSVDQSINLREWQLIEAEVLVERGQCQQAMSLLRDDNSGLQLQQMVRKTILQARCQIASGDRDAARSRLRNTARALASLASGVQNSLLRQMLLPNVLSLRRAAYALRAENEGDVDAAWEWLALSNAVLFARTSSNRGMDSAEFDAEVARLLMAQAQPSAKQGETAARLLLKLLSEPVRRDEPGAANLVLPTLEELQPRLAPDEAFVSVIDGGSESRLLWVRGDRAELVATADPSQWLLQAESLTRRIADPQASTAELHEETERLTRQVFPQGLPAASRYWVDANSSLSLLPWPLMTSGKSGEETSAEASFAHAWIGAKPARLAAADVEVLIASGRSAVGQAELFNAGSEPALILQTLENNGGRVRRVPDHTRRGLVESLNRPTPWLHIAAHGSTESSRLGYAGVWLDSEKAEPGAPAFISSLEVLSASVTRELVVLNACDLAERSARWSSFAEALLRSGAGNVVAARWHVSDGSATLWVPAFYAELVATGEVHRGLRAARRTLQDSRGYRHPAYWASLVHFGRL